MTQTEKILEKLIAYPTISRDSHLAMIQYIESCLGEYGIKSNLTFNDEKTKANLSAVFGPGQSGGGDVVRAFRHGACGWAGLVDGGI